MYLVTTKMLSMAADKSFHILTSQRNAEFAWFAWQILCYAFKNNRPQFIFLCFINIIDSCVEKAVCLDLPLFYCLEADTAIGSPESAMDYRILFFVRDVR